MNHLPDDAGPVLTSLARHSIAKRLGQTSPEPPIADWLAAPGASFVTLTKLGQLRGCIGSLVAWRALGDDVVGNAVAAAFDDPRFMPLGVDELANISIEVSVLSQPLPMTFTSRADALAQLRPGLDGVILTEGRRRATFLPQVWDELPQPAIFVEHLLRKAGLPPNHWSDTVELSRYSVDAFAEAPTSPNDQV